MKAWLSQAGVPFVARDVDEDEQAYDELLALGFRSVPVTVLGDHRIKGYDPGALAAAVAASKRELGTERRSQEPCKNAKP